jgi:hypothetical protein
VTAEGRQCGTAELTRELVWDEYKYRHDLCWRLLFQLTAAVVTLNVVPYVAEGVADKLGYWILAAPAVGLLLALTGWRRLRGEHALLDDVRRRHRDLSRGLYRKEVKSGEGSLRLETDAYMGLLVLAALLNMAMITWKWLPGE